ncbi:hypothetical protein B0G69_1551 [Paraburkholderia sp. RAU2J]|nr:hypothetical protein B0G69_1551 [Paraburkholderia sp. RAU2J]
MAANAVQTRCKRGRKRSNGHGGKLRPPLQQPPRATALCVTHLNGAPHAPVRRMNPCPGAILRTNFNRMCASVRMELA